MSPPAPPPDAGATPAVLVVGTDAAAVGTAVRRLRQEGTRAAGFVGSDRAVAGEMAAELLGEAGEVVVADGARAGAPRRGG